MFFMSSNKIKRYREDGKYILEIELTRADGSLIKLGDILKHLPHGIFDKAITGLGGTTLELDSPRPSIVVEPLNITAFTKSRLKSLKNNLEIHYFGTKSRKAKEGPIRQQLISYLKECKSTNVFPKIVCINDQLVSLKKIIETDSEYAFNEFHLLLDEIDFMQESTTYRESMQHSIEIYFSHPKIKRTLLSATITEFFDPRFLKEKKTVIKVKKFPKVPTKLVSSLSLRSDITNEVLAILQDSQDKILIAHNQISGIKEIIALLILKGISENDIAVLCSPQNETEFKNNYQTISDGGKLPKRINFITSAYFNGFDIEEAMHVILSIDFQRPSLRLSARTLYQIQGRTRIGVTSCTMVFRHGNTSIPKITRENVMEVIKYLEPVNNIYNDLINSKLQFLKNHADHVRNILVNGADGLSSIWSIKNGLLTFSYFKIDKLLEDERVKITLRSEKTFKQEISKYFEVVAHVTSTENMQVEIENTDEDLSTFIDSLAAPDYENPYVKLRLSTLFDAEDSKQKKRVLSIFMKVVRNITVFHPDKVLSALKTIYSNSNISQSINSFSLHIDFHAHITSKRDKRLPSLKLIFYKKEEMAASQLKGVINKLLESYRASTTSSNSKIFSTIKEFDNPYKFERAMLVTQNRKYGKILKTVLSLDPYQILNLEKFPELDLSKEMKYSSQRRVDSTPDDMVQYTIDQLLNKNK